MHSHRARRHTRNDAHQFCKKFFPDIMPAFWVSTRKANRAEYPALQGAPDSRTEAHKRCSRTHGKRTRAAPCFFLRRPQARTMASELARPIADTDVVPRYPQDWTNADSEAPMRVRAAGVLISGEYCAHVGDRNRSQLGAHPFHNQRGFLVFNLVRIADRQ